MPSTHGLSLNMCCSRFLILRRRRLLYGSRLLYFLKTPLKRVALKLLGRGLAFCLCCLCFTRVFR